MTTQDVAFYAAIWLAVGGLSLVLTVALIVAGGGRPSVFVMLCTLLLGPSVLVGSLIGLLFMLPRALREGRRHEAALKNLREFEEKRERDSNNGGS